MDQPDPLIHQPVRLKIVSALNVLPRDDALEFTRLKDIVQATEGNLGAHINALEQAGYVTVAKDFVGKRPRTRVTLSTQGRRAFEDYVDFLRGVIGDAGLKPRT
jgi:DNA-binding MarR family transcriptional regulator